MRVRDNDGCGHDITMGVRESFWAAEDVVEARLIVKGVRRFDGDRAAARTHLSDLALVHVEAGVATAAGLEFDARLVDIGSSGVSFVTTEQVREGDRVRVMATVDSRLVRLRARVLHVTAAHYGRNRIGCEVTELTTADRRLLDALTAAAPSRGSRSERFETRAA